MMGKPTAPEPPDPRETSAAQTGTNIGTAVANNQMGLVNQYTPYGNLEYTQGESQAYNDPYTGETYDIPRYNATTTLNDVQQGTLDRSQAAGQNLAGIAEQQSGFLGDYLSQPADFSTEAIEGRLSELGSQRLDPRFERQREDLRTRLANQGIGQGSEAYNREFDLLGQQENDAYNQLMLQGRGQAFSEMTASRNQPINEITALLSGSQVSNPNVSMSQPQGMATTDNAGLINQNYNQQMQNYQQEMGSWNTLMGGLFGAGGQLGSAAIMSDRRLKKNIRRIGAIGALPVYRFEYLWGGDHVGFMADEVREVAPHAVHSVGGYDAVDYAAAVEAVT